MDRAAMRELACSGALDEISNSEEGDGIEKQVKGRGIVKDGKTQRALLFIVYQTGRHGPQNGFRLALVKEGVRVEDAREKLKGAVEQGLEEFIVVQPDSDEADDEIHNDDVVFQ